MIHATAPYAPKARPSREARFSRRERAAPDPIGRGGAAGFSRRIRRRDDFRDSVQNAQQSERPTGAAIFPPRGSANRVPTSAPGKSPGGRLALSRGIGGVGIAAFFGNFGDGAFACFWRRWERGVFGLFWRMALSRESSLSFIRRLKPAASPRLWSAGGAFAPGKSPFGRWPRLWRVGRFRVNHSVALSAD